nr:DNA gyrase/topoisomerase IV subunit A [Flavobacteriales bacterium]
MSDELDDNLNAEEGEENSQESGTTPEGVPGAGQAGTFSVSGMYREWFLDYASYVILERAVPALYDGLKPVQRRILHSMKDLDDGRYNKVANIIGHTMKYHPHGDASIGDALVQLGQKDLLIDMQGNWGNTLTGDSAAAPRYIEARLSKFASDVVFNPKTTEWQSSYDGRNKEPVFLPVKFPLLLAQGGEGIAVGLSCKVLPHNFNELIDASIAVLRGKNPKLVPDFPTGGLADADNYDEGRRGGRVRCRARIRKEDAKTLVINEIPFGTTTASLIESIIKANEKGKIKIRHIEDNTAADAEIQIHLATGVSPDNTIDALFAFTDCEVSIAPNACVIESDKPRFLGVNELLKISTDNTLRLLELELQIKKAELQEQWHFASLERIFIEKKVYRKIEEAETWEEVISFIDKGLKPYVKDLRRAVTEEDIVRLTEIRIKRISKFDSFKADEHIKGLEEQLTSTQGKLDALVDYAIDYFKELKRKYGTGRERKTELRAFDTIVA